jgi:hypothetical protein
MFYIQTTLSKAIVHNHIQLPRDSSKILVPGAEYDDEQSPLRELQRF